jgi:hypothetical protein
MTILLDAGSLGLISNPQAMETANECRAWMRGQTSRGVRFCLPEIASFSLGALASSPAAVYRR